MMKFQVNQAKSFFLDAARFKTGYLDKAVKASLSRQGAFVRTAARSLIRKRKRESNPGEPPSSHTGVLRRFIYFAWDPAAQSVVIGPAKTNQIFFGNDRMPVKGTVPEILEHGGDITILEVFKYGRWQRADLRSRRRLAGLQMRYRRAHILPRPYMGPALAQANADLSKAWKDSIGRSA